MAQVVFKRTLGEGLVYAAIWVADIRLQFVNDLAVMDLAPGETYEIYWRMAGAEKAKLELTRATGEGAAKKIVDDEIPAGKVKWRDWALFTA